MNEYKLRLLVDLVIATIVGALCALLAVVTGLASGLWTFIIITGATFVVVAGIQVGTGNRPAA